MFASDEEKEPKKPAAAAAAAPAAVPAAPAAPAAAAAGPPAAAAPAKAAAQDETDYSRWVGLGLGGAGAACSMLPPASALDAHTCMHGCCRQHACCAAPLPQLASQGAAALPQRARRGEWLADLCPPAGPIRLPTCLPACLPRPARLPAGLHAAAPQPHRLLRSALLPACLPAPAGRRGHRGEGRPHRQGGWVQRLLVVVPCGGRPEVGGQQHL